MNACRPLGEVVMATLQAAARSDHSRRAYRGGIVSTEQALRMGLQPYDVRGRNESPQRTARPQLYH